MPVFRTLLKAPILVYSRRTKIGCCGGVSGLIMPATTGTILSRIHIFMMCSNIYTRATGHNADRRRILPFAEPQVLHDGEPTADEYRSDGGAAVQPVLSAVATSISSPRAKCGYFLPSPLWWVGSMSPRYAGEAAWSRRSAREVLVPEDWSKHTTQLWSGTRASVRTRL